MYLGIDQAALHTGFVILKPGTNEPVTARLIDASKYKEGQRLNQIFLTIKQLVGDLKIEQAALEGYSYGSTHRAQDLGEVGGIVRLALTQLEIPYAVVAPTSLKKYVTGRGDADKEHMMAAVKSKWGIVIPQDDIADAYGLAHLARGLCVGGSLNRAELEVLELFKGEMKISKLKATAKSRKFSV